MFALLDQEKSTSVGIKLAKNTLRGADRWTPGEQLRNWYHYFNFGFGAHECLGKYVGMVMIPEMVRQVVLRRGIESSGEIDYRDGPFPEKYNLKWM